MALVGVPAKSTNLHVHFLPFSRFFDSGPTSPSFILFG